VEPNTEKSTDDAKVEATYWQSIMNQTNPAVFEAYLKRYPNGAFSELARIKIGELKNEPSKAGGQPGPFPPAQNPEKSGYPAAMEQPAETISPSDGRKPADLHLTIEAAPSDARIKILNHRGTYRKDMPLKPGKYQVEISRPGYQTVTRTVTLDRDDVTLPISLPAIQKGSLKVTSDPAGAAVLADGKKIGETPLETSELSEGSKKIEIRKECFEPVTRIVSIASGQPSVVTVQLTPHCGAVQVTGDPAGADIFIDNERVGSLPMEISGVSPGNRRISVKKDDFQEFEKTVAVQTGKTASVSVSLKKAAKLSKLDGSGSPLPHTATSWSMVMDNESGLIWEAKQNKDSVKNLEDPHDADNTYSWYDGDQKFLPALNDAHFGGFSDWRFPTLNELKTLVVLHRTRPDLYAAFFPDTLPAFYWSSTVNNNSTLGAWGINFGRNGYDYYEGKYGSYCVRAVRGKP
jgi:hypothetical protein